MRVNRTILICNPLLVDFHLKQGINIVFTLFLHIYI